MTAALRFDGLYQAPQTVELPSWLYLRFFSDGVVVSASSIGSSAQVAGWLTREWQGDGLRSIGRYTLEGDELSVRIAITLAPPLKSTVHVLKGRVEGERLNLTFTMDGHPAVQAQDVYRFVAADVR